MKIAIQGESASFHAIAAQRIFGDDVELLFCKTFKDVFTALAEKRVDNAVVAIENSLYGSINEVYDLLLKYNFSICGETYEEIGLHLVGIAGTKLDSITDVYSQAPALGESDVFLETKLPNAERHEHSDTALAAKEVAEWSDTTKAAIASTAAAEKYGLSILEKNIETHSDNYTRFIALSPTPTPDSLADKVSLTFRTADTPGSLYRAMGIFAKADVNLTKLESRPIVGSAWQYMYYFDAMFKLESPEGKQLMKNLEEVATDIRVLGSYQKGQLATA